MTSLSVAGLTVGVWGWPLLVDCGSQKKSLVTERNSRVPAKSQSAPFHPLHKRRRRAAAEKSEPGLQMILNPSKDHRSISRWAWTMMNLFYLIGRHIFQSNQYHGSKHGMTACSNVVAQAHNATRFKTTSLTTACRASSQSISRPLNVPPREHTR